MKALSINTKEAQKFKTNHRSLRGMQYMSKITTEQCKEFLIEHFSNQNINTQEKEWKRLSKYKDKTDSNIVREFSHPNLGVVLLKEINNDLQIIDSANKNINDSTSKPVKTVKSSKNTFTQKTFTAEEKKQAKKLLEQYLERDRESNSSEEDFYLSEQYQKYQHALPSQFTFYFPADTYENHEDNITDGLNTKMKVNDHNSLNVIFIDKNGSDIDSYASFILTQSILPAWSSFCDEYHLDLMDTAPDMTVKEFIQYLLSLGFEYGTDGEEECLFYQEMKKFKIIEESPQKTDKVEKNLSENTLIKKLIKQDNDKELIKMLENGLDPDKLISPEERIIMYAYKNSAFKCINALHDFNSNLWLGYSTNENLLVAGEVKYCIDNMNISDSEKLVMFDNITEIMTKQKDHCTTHEEFIKKHKIFSNRLNTSREFQIYSEKFSKILSEEEINTIFLHRSDYFFENDKKTLENVIAKASEEELKTYIVEHIYSKKMLTWMLQKRPLDMNGVIVPNNNKEIKDYIQDQINDTKNDITRSASGFMIVYVNHNGSRTTQLEKDQRNLSELLALQNAINFHDFNKRRNKP